MDRNELTPRKKNPGVSRLQFKALCGVVKDLEDRIKKLEASKPKKKKSTENNEVKDA